MTLHDNVSPMCPVETRPPATLQEVFQRVVALDVPLGEQLAALTDGFRLVRPNVLAAYDDLVAKLEAIRIGGAGPQVGEPMPAFVLPDQDGRLISLESLLETGPLVISFNRGHWCEYCRLETRALARAQGEIAARGARLVSIVPERSEFIKKFRRSNELEFPVLCDLDLGYALTVGLVVWLGEDITRLYRQAGIDLALFHGNTGQILPVPATFVVGADGLIRARYVDPDFRRRMAVEDILAALEPISDASVTGSPVR
jgi:peroxiredoxin